MAVFDPSTLNAAFDNDSWRSGAATIAVAVGVFIELTALFIFSKEMPKVEKSVMVFATLLIVAGCVGEFIFGSAATNDETNLRQDAERRIGEAAAATEKLRSDNLRLEAEISPRGQPFTSPLASLVTRSRSA
jgi:hypothetical protein